VILALLDRFFTGNRWSLGWPEIGVALLVPILLVAVADRMIRRR
jgi:hypothetical protein